MFIARQPIFNKKLDVFGYELLFRPDSKSTAFGGASANEATATVLGGLFEDGVHKIVDDKYAFINFDEEFIYSDSLELIPPDQLIVEVIESVVVDNKLIKRLEEIKDLGYKIALDDFLGDYDEYPLVPLSKIIKFDLIATPLDTIGLVVKKALADHKSILAEKVETKEVFLQAREMGFHLFQGYFFSKPSIITQSNTRVSSKTQYTRMLWELKKEDPSYDVLAGIIEKDVNLAYRFMKVISNRSQKVIIDSIKSGLTYMGLDEIERWITILMLQDIGKSKPKELIRLSLIRTKFAEEIVKHTGERNMRQEAAMMGLFSILDALFDKTMEEALKDIALTSTIKEALINKKGRLSPVYNLLLAYERGEWIEVAKIAVQKNIDPFRLGKSYLEAVQWANETSVLML